MPALSLSLLGGFRADLGTRSLTVSRKAQALLAHVALSAGRTQTRTRLAALLWGDRPDEQSRNSLRQMLFELRRALGPASDEHLAVDHERVALVGRALSVDVHELERLAGDDSLPALSRAAALYQGDLLAGLAVKEAAFDAWLDAERERLREVGLRAVRALLARHTDAGATEQAIETALRLVALDPLQESAHRALMRLYASGGRGAEALRRYQLCVDTLWRELRVEPEHETKQLYQEIAAQRSVEPPPTSPRGVGRAGSTASAAPASHAHAPLIGRDAEWHRVRAETASGRGARVIALSGEAGIGKTRLTEEIIADALGRGHRVVHGRAHRSEQILPFGLWVTALRASQVTDDADLLQTLGPAWRQELSRLFPELGARPGAARAGIDDHLRIFQAVGELLDALARRQHLVVVLEDVHWADQTSLRLVAFLGRRLAGASASLVLTARVEEVDGSPFLRDIFAEIAREPGLVDVALGPLGREHTALLVRALGAPVGAEIEERVWRASEGNPLVIVETMRTLHERGATPPDGALPIPDGVRRILGERLARLGVVAREVAAVAAVIGREFDLGLLQEATALGTRELAAAMEELVRRRILHQHGEHVDFTHDRIRELAYEEIVEPRRQWLHATVAAAIERRHPHDLESQRAALAGHYRRALVWDKVVAHLRGTASEAAERGAYRDAVPLFEDALRAMGHLPLDGARCEQAIDMHLEARDLLVTLGELPNVLVHLDEAERLARGLGDERRLAHVLLRTSHSCWLMGDQARALELCDTVVKTGERHGDAHLLGLAEFRLGQVRNALGDFDRAVAHLERGLACLADAPNPSRSLGVPQVIARTWLALSLAELGRFDAAVAAGERARADAEATLQRYSIFYTLFQLGRVHLVRGDLERAIPTLEQSAALADTWQIGLMRGACADFLSHAAALAGRRDDAWHRVRAHEPPRSYSAARSVSRGECLLAAGRADEALADAQEAVALARRFGERAHEAKGLCLEAAVRATRAGEGDAARRVYREALDLARTLGMRPLVARCELGLGRLAAIEGSTDAEAQIERAASTFRELGMPYWRELTSQAELRNAERWDFTSQSPLTNSTRLDSGAPRQGPAMGRR